ncbi:Osmotically-inducible protein Y precursor [Leminorella richardii]|uniref:Osmotically-inducible protein Y n=1 Tax=Leminorella richardii TaxID=158841 RepID=A0A2X4V7V3_9GAMM|nr:molecular chaperone OsmY [Leminorella richardii]SQI42802.1 Osmotically-inducible protein Y precursor [Leminorella richardii]
MKKNLFVHSTAAILLTALMGSSTAFAEETTAAKAESVVKDLGSSIETSVDKAGTEIGKSVKKVDGFMDDSTITAKVKSGLLDNKAIQSTDISVKTSSGVVTLHGFVGSDAQKAQAEDIAKKVEGVKSVSNKLQVQQGKESSVEGYVSDTAITSEVKAKLLADSIVPSRTVKVQTSEGAVLLSGTVKTQDQKDQAERVAAQVKGVKSVKNDISIKH